MNELWPWLKPMKPHAKRLLVGGLLMLATVVAGVSLLGLSGWFLTASAITGALLALGVQASLNIYVAGGGIRFFALLRTVARYLERVFNHDTVLRLLADLRVALFSSITVKPTQSAETIRSSTRLSRLTNDIDALDNLYLRLGAPAAVALVISLLVAGLGLLIDTTTAITLLCLFLALFACVSLVLAKVNLSNTRQRVDDLEQLRGDVINTLDAQKELAAAGLFSHRGKALIEADAALMAPQFTADRNTALAQGLVTAVIQIATIVALVSGLAAFQSGLLSGPLLVLMVLALLGVGEAFTALPPAFSAWGATVASAARLNHESRPGSNVTGQFCTQPQPGTLTFDHVSFAYSGHRNTFTGLSFCADGGNSVGFVGRSGTGKSTVADIAAGVLQPSSGKISYPLAPKPDALALGVSIGVSYLPQRTQLFNMTLLDNLLVGNPDASEVEVWRVLDALELSGTVNRWSKGLLTWMGGHDHQLSGGEARRVALARTLLADTPVVILDEPFTGVDHNTTERIRQKLPALLGQRTLIALAHDRDALPNVDQVITLGNAV